MDGEVSRRQFVGGAASGAAVAALGGCAQEQERPVVPVPPDLPHQLGIVTPPLAATTMVSVDVLAPDRTALQSRVGVLASRVEKLHKGVPGPTATVAVGASLFDGRYGLGPAQPSLLTTMPAFPNDVLQPESCHGDLLLQVCAGDARHADAMVKDLLSVVGSGLRERWRISGFRPQNATVSGLSTSRNLFGFREGAGNPDPTDAALMNELVWVRDGEPRWAAGGTYAVVRLIRLATTLWNREPVSRQEQVIGRTRTGDIPLGQVREDAVFDYADDPDGQRVALDAHIRRANPRTEEALQHRMLRRGYSYRRAGATTGEPDEGLIFVCYQRDPEQAFAAAQRRMRGEALERYVLPFGGGYFFVPPSVTALRDLLAG